MCNSMFNSSSINDGIGLIPNKRKLKQYHDQEQVAPCEADDDYQTVVLTNDDDDEVYEGSKGVPIIKLRCDSNLESGIELHAKRNPSNKRFKQDEHQVNAPCEVSSIDDDDDYDEFSNGRKSKFIDKMGCDSNLARTDEIKFHDEEKHGLVGEKIGSIVGDDGKSDSIAEDQQKQYFSDKWIIDSGAAEHICMHRAWFNNYQMYDGVNFVIVGNGSKLQIRGVGSISLMMPNGHIINLCDVHYVPEIMSNIISLSKLDYEGWRFAGIGGVLKIMRTTKEVMTGVRLNNLYIMYGRTLIP